MPALDASEGSLFGNENAKARGCDWPLLSGGLLFFGGVGLVGPASAWPAGESVGFGIAALAALICSALWFLVAFAMKARALRFESADQPFSSRAVPALMLAALAAQAAGAAIILTALIPTNPETEIFTGALAASGVAAAVVLAAMLALRAWTPLSLLHAVLTPLSALAAAVVMLAAGLFGGACLLPFLWAAQGAVAIDKLRRSFQIVAVVGLAVWTAAAFGGWVWLEVMENDARVLEQLEDVAEADVISDIHLACIGDDPFYFLRQGRWRIADVAAADGQEPRATVQFYSWMRIPADTMILRIGSDERSSDEVCYDA